MFGKPQWFREKTFGWGLRPITWQGWIYTLCWTAVMLGPFFALLFTNRIPESIIWLAVSIVILIYDVALILKEVRKGQNKKSKPVRAEDQAAAAQEEKVKKSEDDRIARRAHEPDVLFIGEED